MARDCVAAMLRLALAGLAQLVEHKLPKLGVASSNLVSRSDRLGGVGIGLFGFRQLCCMDADNRWRGTRVTLNLASSTARGWQKARPASLVDGEAGLSSGLEHTPVLGDRKLRVPRSQRLGSPGVVPSRGFAVVLARLQAAASRSSLYPDDAEPHSLARASTASSTVTRRSTV